MRFILFQRVSRTFFKHLKAAPNIFVAVLSQRLPSKTSRFLKTYRGCECSSFWSNFVDSLTSSGTQRCCQNNGSIFLPKIFWHFPFDWKLMSSDDFWISPPWSWTKILSERKLFRLSLAEMPEMLINQLINDLFCSINDKFTKSVPIFIHIMV